jgi:DNA-binding CsgD family transcriptional regulator/tetratricopeptide (TPR) repeat protein
MPGRHASARFVGRADAFARLASAVDQAVVGHPTTVLVTAEIGGGATRFIDEAAIRIGRVDGACDVIRCRVDDDLDGRPYGPIVAGLGPVLRALPDEAFREAVGPSGSEVARMLPSLEPRLQALELLPARLLTSDPERRQPRLLEGLLGVLTRLGERRPIMLVIEDLHRADAATRSFAAFVSRVARGQRVCVVATYQPDAVDQDHPLRATLASMAAAPRPPRALRLPPLDRDELADLVADIEGARPSASELLLVAERSLGNPLVAEEVLAARRELSSTSLTGSLEGLVTARLALRSPECRRALRLVAPAGRPVRRQELADIAAAFESGRLRPPPRSTSGPRRGDGVLDPDLAAGIAEAIEHGFLRERALAGSTPDETGGVEELVLEPRHELIARAVLGDLLPRQRPRHHAALAVVTRDRPALACRHWLAAHRPADARAAAIQEAEQAERHHAPDDALAALELALELTDAAGFGPGPAKGGRESIQIGPLQARAAEHAFAAGSPHRAVAYVEAALAAEGEHAHPTEAARLLIALGRYRRAAGDHEGALEATRRAVALLRRDRSVERARALAALAQLRMLDGTFSEAIELAEAALAIARSIGPEALGEEAHALATLGVSEGWGDRPDLAVEHLHSARSIAAVAGRLDEVFRCYANLTTILDLQGRREEAVAAAYEGIEAARSVGQEAVYGNFLRGNAGDSLFYLGRWDEARALALTSLEWSPAGIGFVNSAINLAIVEVESDASELAGRLLGRLLLELETTRDSQFAGPVYQAAASFALWRDDLDDAHHAAELAWERVRDTEDWVLAARVAAAVLEVAAAFVGESPERRDLGALAAVRELAARVLEEASSSVAASGVGVERGSRREAEARLATARAYADRLDGHVAAARWAAVAERWIDVGERYQVAKARWRQAEAVLAAEDSRTGRAEARRPLEDAAIIALDLGARPLLRRIDELATRARIRLPEALFERIGAALAREPAISVGGRAPVAIPVASRATPPEAAWLDPEALLASVTGAVMGGSTDRSHEPSAIGRELAAVGASAGGDAFGLSQREREVLALIAEGRTNREIGERLFISQKTVGVHVGNILAKLKVSGRVEAATVAIRLGLTQLA